MCIIDRRTTALTHQYLLNYQNAFGKHNVSAMAGFEGYRLKYVYFYGNAQQLDVYKSQHLADPDLNVEKLTEKVGISRAQLHRKPVSYTHLAVGLYFLFGNLLLLLVFFFQYLAWLQMAVA